MNHSRVQAAAFVYWGYVLILTFYPFELSAGFSLTLDHILTGFDTVLIEDWRRLGLRDFVLNLLLFIPLGLLLSALWEDRQGSSVARIALITLCGALASFGIEFGQVFASRNPSVFDIASNTLGTALGALGYSQCKRWGIELTERLAATLHSRVAVCWVLLFAVLPLAFSAEQLISPFWRWDSRYSLRVGNEATMDRPWFGRMYLIALYRRALSPDEIRINFNAGLGPEAIMKRRRDDLIALYEFTEGAGNMIHDTSESGTSLDLEIPPESRIRWLEESRGIEIAKRSIVRSVKPAAKLVEAVKASQEVSIEIWMAPRSTWKGQAARIVSLSGGSGPRNLILGQQGMDIQFRLRGPALANTGTAVGLQTTGGVLRKRTTHVVVTYKDGVERLYLDGVQRPEIFNLKTDEIVGFGTRKTAIAQLAYSFLYFFPVAFVLCIFLSGRSEGSARWLLSVGAATGLLAMAEIVQAFGFDRPIEFRILGFGLLMGVLGTFTGRTFAGIKTCQ